jgi:hypothetical protein
MLTIRLLIIILIVLVAAAALTQLNPSAEKTAKPLLEGIANVQSWFGDKPVAQQPDKPANTEQVYKWQDASGEWHFSNQPPPEGVASSVKIYRTDANITQAVETPPEPASEPAATADIPQGAAPLLPITDPERVQQLVEDAKNVQKLMDQRVKDIDAQTQ